MNRFRNERGRRTARSAPARVSPWKAVLRASRRDLYVLFLESERLPHEVVENLPDEGMRRVLGVPVEADIAVARARLAERIDEKRALVKPFRREGMSLARATRHIAYAWAESDADRLCRSGAPLGPALRRDRSSGKYFRSGWKSVPSATKETRLTPAN